MKESVNTLLTRTLSQSAMMTSSYALRGPPRNVCYNYILNYKRNPLVTFLGINGKINKK